MVKVYIFWEGLKKIFHLKKKIGNTFPGFKMVDLKVSKFQKDFLVSSILPKNERKTNEKIRLIYYDTSGRLISVPFSEEFEDTKKTFRN